MSSRWPSLGVVANSLDYSVALYDSKFLRTAGERLQKGEPLGPIRWEVGQCLLRLADNAAALRMLNRYSERASLTLRQLNMAVHYLAKKELLGRGGSEQAFAHVANAWNITTKRLKEAFRAQKLAASNELEFIVRMRADGPSPLTRRQVMGAVEADMLTRSQFTWAKPRKKSSPA